MRSRVEIQEEIANVKWKLKHLMQEYFVVKDGEKVVNQINVLEREKFNLLKELEDL